MIEDAVRDAIVAELERQAAGRPQALNVRKDDANFTVDGSINLDELVMAVLGAVAGGPCKTALTRRWSRIAAPDPAGAEGWRPGGMRVPGSVLAARPL